MVGVKNSVSSATISGAPFLFPSLISSFPTLPAVRPPPDRKSRLSTFLPVFHLLCSLYVESPQSDDDTPLLLKHASVTLPFSFFFFFSPQFSLIACTSSLTVVDTSPGGFPVVFLTSGHRVFKTPIKATIRSSFSHLLPPDF